MDGKLVGRLSAVGGLRGTLSATATLKGSLSLSGAAGAPYTGAYEVTPKAYDEQVLPTNGLTMLDDVTVFRVPYYETSNLYDGLTVYIATEV